MSINILRIENHDCFDVYSVHIIIIVVIRYAYIKSMCDSLSSHPVDRALGQMFHEVFDETCGDMNIRWIAMYTREHRRWAYQQCSGLGWVPNTSSRNQPFGTAMSLDTFYFACRILFGAE